jgi:hypothetical protein
MGEPDVPHGFFVSALKRPWKAYSMAFLFQQTPLEIPVVAAQRLSPGRGLFLTGQRRR